MKSAHLPLFRVLGGKVRKVTAATGAYQERGSARRPPYGGGGPAGGVLLSPLTPHSAFQRVRAGKPPLHSNMNLFFRPGPKNETGRKERLASGRPGTDSARARNK